MNFHAAIVVPCFNEGNRFDSQYFNNLVSIKDTYWVFVDDGSTDNTSSILANFCKRDNTKYIRTQINLGKSSAVANGMADILRTYNSVPWIGFIDSDGAFAIQDIEKILGLTKTKHANNFDSIYSARVKLSGRSIQRKIARHYIGRLIAFIFGIFWRDIPYDTQSGFKLYRGNLLTKQVLSNPFLTKWFFDIELHVRIEVNKKNKFRVWEEPVEHWRDIPGSRLNFLEGARVTREITRILVLLYRHTRH